jgi:hypothetical protein
MREMDRRFVFGYAAVIVLLVVVAMSDILLSWVPGLAMPLAGQLAEATVTEEGRPASTGEVVEQSVAVQFIAVRHPTGKGAKTIRRNVTTTVALPRNSALDVSAGAKLFVTYLPGSPEHAVFGNARNHSFGGNYITALVGIAALSLLLAWMLRSRELLAEIRRADGRHRFVLWGICAALSVLLAYAVTAQNVRWEWGMAHAKRLAASEIVDLKFDDGKFTARFAFETEDGLVYSGWRRFDALEIGDPHKMQVGRKFNVAYVAGAAAYNRPDWVEALHAPTRKLSIAMGMLLGLEFLAIFLISCYWSLQKSDLPVRQQMEKPLTEIGKRLDRMLRRQNGMGV